MPQIRRMDARDQRRLFLVAIPSPYPRSAGWALLYSQRIRPASAWNPNVNVGEGIIETEVTHLLYSSLSLLFPKSYFVAIDAFSVHNLFHSGGTISFVSSPPHPGTNQSFGMTTCLLEF